MEPIIEAMVEAEERLLLEQEIEYRSILGGQDYITDPSFFEQGQQASTSRTAVDFITLSGNDVDQHMELSRMKLWFFYT